MKRQLKCLAGLAIVAICASHFSGSSSTSVSLTDAECESLIGALASYSWACGSTPASCTACTPHSCTLVPPGIFIGVRHCTNDGTSGCSITYASRFTCYYFPFTTYLCDDDAFNTCGFERVPGMCAVPVRNVGVPGFNCPAAPACGIGAGGVTACNGCS